MNRRIFFDSVRVSLFENKLSESQVAGMNVKLDAFQKAFWPIAWAAYGMATSYHETNRTMQPIREYSRGKGKKYGKPSVYGGQIAYGRGDVQITWADPPRIDNYAKADLELAAMGLIKKGDLLADFDLALRPDLSAAIMVEGMEAGWFTGKKNADFLTALNPDYVRARAIINGKDHAVLIAGYAKKFEKALREANYCGMSAWSASKEPLEAVIPPPPDIPKPEPQEVSSNKRIFADFVAKLIKRFR